MMKREVDYYKVRAQNWTTQHASSNYYPINAGIMVHDEILDESLIVTNDRAQGGSAYRNGTIEVMINRRVSNTSDELGNEERLNEIEIFYREGDDPLI
jgi:hypothetical protein